MTEIRVYFIKPRVMDGPIKIGCSALPQSRLEALMAWSPWPLEIIGSVPGSLKDEQWLHRCFADCHSHNEWFRSAPHLRDAIREIVAAGSLDGMRSVLVEKGSVRKKRSRSPEQRSCQSYAMKVNWAERKLRLNTGIDGAWRAPDDVTEIISCWQKYIGQYGSPDTRRSPSDADFARLHEYLANPEAHSIVPAWRGTRRAA